MKKALMLVAAIAMLASTVYAEDAVAEPTVEERVAALEAAPASPLTVTGALNFGIGADFSTNENSSLTATSGAAATAKLGIASKDAKVTAELTVDLMAIPSVATTLSDVPSIGTALTAIEETSIQKQEWDRIVALVDWWNDHSGDESDAGVALFDNTDMGTIVTAIDAAYGGVTVVVTDADAIADYPKIELMSPVQVGTTPGTDEFLLNDAAFTAGDAATVVTAIEAVLQNGLNEISLGAAGTYATDIDAVASDYNTYAAILNLYVESEILAMTADDKTAINDTLSLLKAWHIIDNNLVDPSATTTATQLIKGAKIVLNDIAGVVDLTMNFDGQHASAGMFTLDKNGHQEDAVTGYPSIAATLNSDVVSGLTAGVEFFMDANDLDVDVSDDAWTWLDETDTKEETRLGFGINAGYMLPIGDMTVGATAEFAMYDVANTTPADVAWGFSVKPSFKGFGANVGVQFDMGLGMTYFAANADYTIFGITPSVYFKMLSGMTADDTLVWNDDAKDLMSNWKNDGGNLLGFGLVVDLGTFLPFAAKVNGGADLYLLAAGMEYAWNAGLSITPLTDLTVKAGFGDDSMKDGLVAWNAGISYKIVGISASVDVMSSYNDDKEAESLNFKVGLGYTYGNAVLTGTVGTAYDDDEGKEVATFGLNCKVTF